MSYTSNITKSRFQARHIYLAARARNHVQDGPTSIHLPGKVELLGEVRSHDGRPRLVFHCSALFVQHPKCPALPLREGDCVDYEIRNGALHVLSLKRGPGSGNPTEPLQLQRPSIVPNYSGPKVKTASPANNAPSPYALINLDILPPLPLYLQERRQRISRLGEQVLPPWQDRYNTIGGAFMDRLRRRFPNQIISRADLAELYAGLADPGLALVATMVWGHINSTDGNRLATLLAEGEQLLSNKMIAICNRVRSGQFDSAFVACSQGGALKLPGVNVSFFTKLFHFAGAVPQSLNPMPLIFDKWTGHALLALGLQQCPQIPWKDFYDVRPMNEGQPGLFKRSGDKNRVLYRLYVAWMNHWAASLEVTPAKLEQFVFGHSRKTVDGKRRDNPRNELIKLAKDVLGTESGNQFPI